MRLKSRMWIGLIIALAVTVALVWQVNGPRRRDGATPAGGAAPQSFALRLTNAPTPAPVADAVVAPMAMPGRFAVVATNAPNAPFTHPLAHRLTNTTLPLDQLMRSDSAVLLRNALLDTTRGGPAIPAHLRSVGNPGAYIVQARGVITDDFRAQLRAAGAEIVSYVPNNAYLVRASAGAARVLSASPSTLSVLPFEPYYKLDPKLLALAVNRQLSPHGLLNIVTFPGAVDGARAALEKLGATVVGQAEPTPFGEVLVVKAPADKLSEVAQVTDVQMLGVRYEKRLMNDLSRVLVKISTNVSPDVAIATGADPTQYQYRNDVVGPLTGDGVTVAIADSGVDQTHPDLSGRVFGPPAYRIDFDGHGTHVAGTLLGNGTQSPFNDRAAQGSQTNGQFSGMAPKAKAWAQSYLVPDYVLHEETAAQDILISNNSWGRPGANDYDIYAASYDAAVRDSRPGVTGEQQVMYVFAAGNEGAGGGNGLNGLAGSIISPATAKNVITVGASDLPRLITNTVANVCVTVPVITTDTNTGNLVTNLVITCETNQPWWNMTDTNNQVSPYSSRGNVGIGREGLFGRFKPDVVAPGSMLVSTRSKDYLEPSGFTNTTPFTYNNLAINVDSTNLYSLAIPANAVSVTIITLSNATSPTNMTLTIAAAIDGIPGDVGVVSASSTNLLTLNGTTTPAISAGTLFYTVANNFHSNVVGFDLAVLLVTTNDVGDYFEVLKALNDPLKVGAHGYRYEYGTSMAAPVVSGFLALIQEFLGTNGARPSPALLKALLINGSRSLSANYSLSPNAPINSQGWGLVNMSNSIPAGFAATGSNGPMRFYDQSLNSSLATGGTETYTVSVPVEARSYPLRVTLVWTDPPGNPLTSVKLVNDMNLMVFGTATNSVVVSTNSGVTNGSSLLWLGNNFPAGSDFTDPITVSTTDTNQSAATNLNEAVILGRDYVNNVENVFIRPPLAASYTVVVKAHRVNVNSVFSHTNRHAQDYALVISSGDGTPSNNVNLAVSGPVFTNDFSPRTNVLAARSGGSTNRPQRAFLVDQRVGANNPLIVNTNGASNQWSFYAYTNVNDASYTNVVVAVFLSPNLSRSRNRDADIDLYVARGPGAQALFDLNDTVIANSRRSVGRGGTEYVYFNDATSGQVFYIGVKSEDQQAVNFSIFAESRNGPFSSTDESNNIIATAFGPFEIPDGTPEDPGGVEIPIFLDAEDIAKEISRVYVTNSIYHEEAGDIIGILGRPGEDKAVALNNHRTWTEWENPTAPYGVVYDDSGQGDLGDEMSTPPVFVPDGPGRLLDFLGDEAGPAWNFRVSDNALFHTGYVQEVTLVIEPALTNLAADGVVLDRFFCVQPGGWTYAAFNVGADVFNAEICLSEFNLGGSNDIAIFVRHGDFPDFNNYDHLFVTGAPGGCFNIGLGDNPPLRPGRYYLGFFNSNATERICFRGRVTLDRTVVPGPYAIFTSGGTPTSLLDDATTNSFIVVTNGGRISDLRVGLRVAHERASDLAFHLVSPQGTRVLLFENRGRTNSLGIGASVTNVTTNLLATLINDGFDDADGAGFGSRAAPNYSWNLGEVFSGWTVDSDNVETVHAGYGLSVPPHSGSNAIDLIGFPTPGHPTSGPGAVSSNVTTRVGSRYRLSFAYCKNPGSSTLIQQARVELNSQPATNFTYALVNDYWNPNWQSFEYYFYATSPVTKIGFRQVNPTVNGDNGGMFIDTVRLDEISVKTNLFLYTTFTENTNLTVTPIKFGLPPFTNSPNPQSTLVLDDGFENLSSNIISSPYGLASPTVVSGWRVETGSVDIVAAYLGYPPDSGTFALDINGFNAGRISTNVFTDTGSDYLLTFAFRRNPSTNLVSAQASVTLDSGSVVTSLLIDTTNAATWTTTSIVFTAQSPVTRLLLEGLIPGDGGIFFDTFKMQKLAQPLSLDSAYFLPEEPLTPIFGEDAGGVWRLEVWDSRLGAAVSAAALVSWRLEISYTQTNPPSIVLTNGVEFTNVVEGVGVVYFSVPVSCPAGVITNILENLTGNGGLDLIFNQFTLPTNGPGDVAILTDVMGVGRANLFIGVPPLVSPTRYYLAVRNTDPTRTNLFRLRFDEGCETNVIIAISTNEVCRTIAASDRDYFTYTLPPGLVAIRFETYAADGNVDLFARSGYTPPLPGFFGIESTNPGTADEIAQSITNQIPFGVQPGPWSIMVINNETNPVNYCIRITEFYPGHFLPIQLGVGENVSNAPVSTAYYVVDVDQNYCQLFFTAAGANPPVDLPVYVSWHSVPAPNDYDYAGVAVSGSPTPAVGPIATQSRLGYWFVSVVNTNAFPVDYTIQAVSSVATCLVGPVIKSGSANYSASGGFTLAWTGSSSEAYQVQYTEHLGSPLWQTITNVITSPDGNFQFTDSGATTNVQRFYRLIRLP